MSGADGAGAVAVLAPGQGSQQPGMLAPWLELPRAPELVAGFSEAAQLDLAHLGTQGSAEDLLDTAVAQPLIVAASLLAAAFLDLPLTSLVAGHSVGEVTALVLAGVLEPAPAVGLAADRGRAMAGACPRTETGPATGMAAVVGGEEEGVLAGIAAAGLQAANRNGAGQIVAAGSLADLERLAADPPAGGRVFRLPVAGAFHTEAMAPAGSAFAAAARRLKAADPLRVLLGNADGAPVGTGAEAVDRLVAQLTRPVRWDLCQAALRTAGVDTVVLLPPSGALAGLARRELPGVTRLAVTGPESLDAVRERFAVC